MFCPKCGSQIQYGLKVCNICGANLENQASASNYNQNRPGYEQENIWNRTEQSYNQYNQNAGYRQTGNYNAQGSSGQFYNQPDFNQSGAYNNYNASGNYYPHLYHKLGGWLAFFAYLYLIYIPFLLIGGFIGIFHILSVMILGFSLNYILYVILRTVGTVITAVLCYKMFSSITNKDSSFLALYEITGALNIVWTLLPALIFKNVFPSVVFTIIQFGLVALYYTKSVRVRTYFGTDEYLRKSRLFKNFPSPIPADNSQNTGYY